MSASGRARERLLTIATAAATLAAVAVVANRSFGGRSDQRGSELTDSRTVTDWYGFASRGARIGPLNARVTIVEFSDFACPACRIAAARFRELLRRHPEDVALVYRHFPLDARSRQASVAAECARRAGAFEPMHDLLFAKAESLGTKPWMEFAKGAGIVDTVKFASCLTDTTVIAAVWGDTRAGDSLYVDKTPSFLVNGQFFEGAPDLDGLDAYVSHLAAKAK